MRTLGATLVAALCLLLLARPTLAGPPPPPTPEEDRPLAPILVELAKSPQQRPGLAVGRWYADVHDVKVVSVPTRAPLGFVGSPPKAVSEAIARCELPKGEKKAAAAKILAEFGEALPLKLKAIALASGGKTAEAVQILQKMAQQTVSEGPCAPEHPSVTHSRQTTLDSTESCIKAFDPKADVSAVTKARARLKHCMATMPPPAG